ncbi:MAG: c-type cytochrome [Limisphaerales bacterium]
MKIWVPPLLLATVFTLLGGCGQGRGFHLPQGDVDRGKAAFVAMKCYNCHKVSGVDLPAPVSTVATNVTLGGEVTYIQSYGELVTCVIDPSHSLADNFKRIRTGEVSKLSPMPEYNSVMTVQQLVDIVTFLQSRYKKIEPPRTRYFPGTATARTK